MYKTAFLTWHHLAPRIFIGAGINDENPLLSKDRLMCTESTNVPCISKNKEETEKAVVEEETKSTDGVSMDA